MEAERNASFQEYSQVLKRRRKLALRIGLGAVLIAIVVAFVLPTLYRSSGTE